MRKECKHYQSRTYRSGEVVSFCRLDLAPEAPWRCPEECARFERRLADVAWNYGSLVSRPTVAEPPGVEGDSPDVAALLDAAEEIVNSAGPSIRDEVFRERAARRQAESSPWKRVLRRFRRR